MSITIKVTSVSGLQGYWSKDPQEKSCSSTNEAYSPNRSRREICDLACNLLSLYDVYVLVLPYTGHLHQDLIGCQDSWRNYFVISYLLSSSQQLAIQSSL